MLSFLTKCRLYTTSARDVAGLSSGPDLGQEPPHVSCHLLLFGILG